MSLFDNTTATDAGFDVNSIFDAILTVYGFFRQIIDFLKSIFTPIFESLFDSAGDKLDEMLAG